MADWTNWVLADASTMGVVRFGMAQPGDRSIGQIRAMPSDRHLTFTDALLTYVGEAGINLREAGCIFSVAGPTAGDAIPIARSRWTVSRSGLGSMFRGPVTLVNDMAAVAWSLLGEGGPLLEPLGGRPVPGFGKAGRWVVVLIDDGLGFAVLDIDDHGNSVVTDTEGGHMGFSPADADEFALMGRIGLNRGHVSWEQALGQALARPDRQGAAGEMLAGMIGAFAGDAILATGAWSGVIVTGKHTGLLRDPACQARFADRLEGKSRFGRLLTGAARCILPVRDPLQGTLALLNIRHPACTPRAVAR